MALQPGQTVGQYQIVEQLGQGGMATVYRAYHARLDRHVAVKVMHQALLDDPNFKARFEREAQIVGRLEHASIVPVYDYDEIDHQPYLVMKQIEGRTLKVAMGDPAFTMRDALRVMTAIAAALDYAHGKGVLHRDIKPSNIIIAGDGTAYLTDFGLARIAQAGASTMSADMMLGTPHYISPEQARGEKDLTPATDLYSLGIILYELVAGRVPFAADTPYAIIHDQIYAAPPAPSELNPNVSPEVETVLLQALSKDPTERFPSAAAMVEALRAALEGASVALPTSGKRDPASLNTRPVVEPRADTPPRQRADGRFVTIPTPVPAPAADDSIEGVVRQVGQRFKELAADVGVQFRRDEGKVQVEFKGKLREVAEEIRNAVQNEVNEQMHPGGRSDGGAAAALVEREWGASDEAIVKRARKRVETRNEFFTHAVIYGVVMTGMFLGWSAISPIINGVLADTDLWLRTFMATLPVPQVLGLAWGVGLVNHGIAVVQDNSTRQRETRRRMIFARMERRYGPDWVDTATARQYKKVRNDVNEMFENRNGFVHHVVSYVMVLLMLSVAWSPVSTMLGSILDDAPAWLQMLTSTPAPIGMIAGLWGIGLLIHALSVLQQMVSGGGERELESEIERERRLAELSGVTPVSLAKRKNEDASLPAVRLTGDGELTDSFVQQYDDDARRKRGG